MTRVARWRTATPASYSASCCTPRSERNDIDGAEVAYRAAIKADPGHANAVKQGGFLEIPLLRRPLRGPFILF